MNVTSASKGNTGRGSKVDKTRGAPASTGPMGSIREASSCAARGATRAKSAESSLRSLTAGLAQVSRLPSSGGGLSAPSEPVPNWKPPLSYLRRPGFAEAAPSSQGSTASRLQSNGGSEEDCPRLAA